jgi:hypothetical protein
MSVLEVKKAIAELNPAEISELKAWLEEQEKPWYEREPDRSRIQAGLESAQKREPQETDLDAFEAMVLKHLEEKENRSS